MDVAKAPAGTPWPLYRISEPHETNDVLLTLPESKNQSRSTNNEQSHDSGKTEDGEESSPIPYWRSQDRQDAGSSFLSEVHGNERFMELLRRHVADYEQRSKMEKPLVTVKVLQEWRNQDPPGRFLVVESGTTLWKDVGDKKARTKISKAFKYLSKTHASAAVSAIVGSSNRDKIEQENTPQKSNITRQQAGDEKEDDEHVLLRVPGTTIVQQPLQPPATSISISTITTSTSSLGQSQRQPSEGCATLSFRRASSLEQQAEEESKSGSSGPIMVSVSNFVRHHSESEEAKRASLYGTKRRPPPPFPARYQKPEKYTRRISEQLKSSAKERGTMLYGRSAERQLLATIYARQKQQRALFQKERASCQIDLVLIGGSMGVGKTTLAQTLRDPLLLDENHVSTLDDDDNEEAAKDKPFFFFFKSEPCKYSDPTKVFSTIITDFCDQLLQRGDRKLTQRYCTALVETLKEDITLLSNLSPALDALLTKKSWASSSITKSTSSGSDSAGSSGMDQSISKLMKEESKQEAYACMAMQRIKEVFALFLQTVASVNPQQSAIVLWDDIHWASEESMNNLMYLVTNTANCGILFMGTYREDEADEPRFKKSWQMLHANPNVNVTDIDLENLKEDTVHCMLAEALCLPEEQTSSLNKLVCQLTKGNPTFITELLRLFQEKGLLQFDDATQQWTCDFEQIPLTLGNIHSVPDLFKAKVLVLPDNIQETLKIAACLMNSRIDESYLKMIDTVGAVESHLKFADIRGLLTYRNGFYWFASDGVKQAVHDLIPEADRPAYHLRIGSRLWLHLEDHQNTSFYSVLMTQMMLADSMISNPEDRRAVAALCLDAGRKAAKFLGFQTSWLCLSYGIRIVSAQKTWGRDNYDLSLSLFNTAIEVCYCNGEFSQLDDLLQEVLHHARSFEDSLLARSTMIYSLGTRNKQLEAIELGLATLKELGETFPSKYPSTLRVYWEQRRVKSMLKGLSDDDILHLRRMKGTHLAAMKILNHVILYAIYASPTLSALMAFRMVELTMRYGLNAFSSVGFVLYGMILCRYDQIDEGFRFGSLALKICRVYGKAVWVCRTWAGFYGTIHCRKLPAQDAIEPLRKAEKAGMRAGDVEFAILNACLVCWNSSELLSLPALENELRTLGARVEFYGQALSLVMIKPLWQMALNFMGKAEDPKILKGELIDEDLEQAKEGINGVNPHFWIWIRFFQMKISFHLGDLEKALEFSDTTREIYINSAGAMDGAYTMFYECMVLLAQARKGKRRYRNLMHVRRCLNRLKEWAYHAPQNFLGKQLLLEAEIARVRGNRPKAYERYRSAMFHSAKAGMVTEQALANEQLGRYVMEKDAGAAIPHLQAAMQLYEKWGATVIVRHLEEEFCELIEED